MTAHPDGAAPPPDAGQVDGEFTALLRRAHLDRREALDALVLEAVKRRLDGK